MSRHIENTSSGSSVRQHYRAVLLPRVGGPEVLQTVELPLEPPGPNQIRVRIVAAGVGSTDLTMLAGLYNYAPPMPFVPGYEIAGVVDAIGSEVWNFTVGQRSPRSRFTVASPNMSSATQSISFRFRTASRTPRPPPRFSTTSRPGR